MLNRYAAILKILQYTGCNIKNIAVYRLQYLRVNVTKNQRNRGHSSKFNFAHTLSIGRPKSHTYDKDVRLLKFSLVWEKST